MPPPKLLTGELAKLADDIAKALEKRLSTLAPEDAAAIARAAQNNPEFAVALDEAMEKGKVQEVTGTGVGGRKNPDAILRQQLVEDTGYRPSRGMYRATFDRSQEPGYYKYVGGEEGWEISGGFPEHAFPAQAVKVGGRNTLETDNVLNRLQNVDDDNRAVNESLRNQDARAASIPRVLEESTRAGNSKVGFWPQSWIDNENIPKFLGGIVGAGAGAAALVSGQAQAQTPPTFEPDLPPSFTPDEEPQLQGNFVPAPGSKPEKPVADALPPSFEPDYEQPQPSSGGNNSLYSGQPTGMPELLKRPAEPEFGGQTEGDVTYTPGPLGGVLPSALDAITRFEKKHIDPIIRANQKLTQEAYFGGTADEDRMEGLPARGFGGYLRDVAPGLAYTAENAGRLFLGETDVNKPGSENPVTRLVQDKAEQKFGVKGAAYHQALLQNMSNLPLYIIPGAGENSLLQGLTGGALSAAADPEQSIVEGAVGGAVVGGTLGLVAKGAQAGYSKIKGKLSKTPKLEPIAVIPGDEESAFADTVIRMSDDVPPQEVLPAAELPPPLEPPKAGGKKPEVTGVDSPRAKRAAQEKPAAKDVVAVATALDDSGQPLTKALVIQGSSVRTVLMPPKDAPKGVKRIISDAAKDYAIRNPNSPLTDKIYPPPEGTFDLGRRLDLSDWDAGHTAEVREGSVLVSDGEGGTARLYDISSPKLQRAVLRERGLAELTTPDGRKVRGFLSGDALLPPDIDEAIPLAAKEVMDASQGEVRLLESDNDLKNILVEREQLLNQRADEAAKFEADLVARERDIAAGGDGSGGNLPPPPPQAPPPPPPPKPHNVGQLDELKGRWAQSLAGRALSWAERQALNPTVRGIQDVADQAFAAHSVDTLQRLAPDTLKQLEAIAPEIRQMKPWQQRKVHADLTSWLLGEIPQEKLLEKQPLLSKTLYDRLNEHKMRIAEVEARLKELGMLDADARANELIGDTDEQANYLVRNYFRYLLKPGEWSKLKKSDEVGYNLLKQAIKEDVYQTKAYKHLTEESKDIRAQEHLDLLLGDPDMMKRAALDPNGSWVQAVTQSGGSLKRREVMTWWKKAALGDIDNAFVRIAETRARQEQLLLMGETYRTVADNPQLSTFGDMPDVARAMGHTVPVPKQPKYGLLAGKYTSPEMWEALVQAPLAQRNLSGFIAKSVNAIKYARTVGNLGSWITNFVANGQGAMLSNLVNPFASPYKIGHGMLTFTRDLKAHKLAPGIRGDLARDRFARAMELGVVGSDYATAEFRESVGEWSRILERELEATKGADGKWRVNPLNLFPRILKRATNMGLAGKAWLAKKYGGIDTLWKYATYVSGLEKGGIDTATGKMDVKKAIDFIDSRYRPGMSDAAIREAVELEVAQRIHYSFPMMDRVGNAVATANKYGAPGLVVNPFFKVKSELYRNYAQLPRRMLREKGMAGNLLGYAAVAGGLYYGVRRLREAMGVNQDEVDRSHAAAPASVQRFKPGALALWFRGEDGRLAFVDMTSTFEPFSWLQGDPQTNWATRAIQNMAMSPVDGSVIEAHLVSELAKQGIVDPGYADRMLPEWQRGGVNGLLRAGLEFGPATAKNTYTTLERGGVGFTPKGVRGPQQSPQPGWVTATNLVLGPNRVYTAGGAPGGAGDAEITRAIQLKGMELKAASAEMSRIGAMNEGQSTGTGSTPLTKAQALQKQREIIERLKTEMADLKAKLGRN